MLAAAEIENTVSELFQQERGVRQGSVLSPTLFLVVMDEMLKEMSVSGTGVSIADLYLGSAAHADDIMHAPERLAIAMIISTKYSVIFAHIMHRLG